MQKLGMATMVGLVVALGSLGACTSGSQTGSDSQLPDTSEPVGTVSITEIPGEWPQAGITEDSVTATQDNGEVTGLEVTLGGSGTKDCAPVLEGGLVSGEELLLTLAPVKEGQACTADLVPYSWQVTVEHPERITNVLLEDADHQVVNQFRINLDSEES